MDELQRVAERMMRAELAKLPDGVHTFTDYIDGVGDEPVPIPICVRVEIAGDEVLISFEGTSPQVDASVNCPVGMVRAACYCAIRGIVGGEIPNCEGYMRPIRIDAPAGTVVNPVLPAACGARGVIGYRVYDALMGALAPIVPDRVLAAGEGGPTLIAFGGYDEERRPFGTTEVLVGTWGARADEGRARGRLEPAREPRQPAGRAARGGHPARGRALRARARLRRRRAAARRARLRARVPRATPRATLTIRTDRRDHPPYGLEGGEPGAPSSNVVESATGSRELPTMPMEASHARRGRPVHATSRRAAAASARRSSATPRRCSRTCSTRRCRSPPRGSATAS